MGMCSQHGNITYASPQCPECSGVREIDQLHRRWLDAYRELDQVKADRDKWREAFIIAQRDIALLKGQRDA